MLVAKVSKDRGRDEWVLGMARMGGASPFTILIYIFQISMAPTLSILCFCVGNFIGSLTTTFFNHIFRFP